jgi:hypothetical protein
MTNILQIEFIHTVHKKSIDGKRLPAFVQRLTNMFGANTKFSDKSVLLCLFSAFLSTADESNNIAQSLMTQEAHNWYT